MARKIIQLMGYANDTNRAEKYCLCDDGTVWSRELISNGRPTFDPLATSRWGWKQVDTSDITDATTHGSMTEHG